MTVGGLNLLLKLWIRVSSSLLPHIQVLGCRMLHWVVLYKLMGWIIFGQFWSVLLDVHKDGNGALESSSTHQHLLRKNSVDRSGPKLVVLFMTYCNSICLSNIKSIWKNAIYTTYSWSLTLRSFFQVWSSLFLPPTQSCFRRRFQHPSFRRLELTWIQSFAKLGRCPCRSKHMAGGWHCLLSCLTCPLPVSAKNSKGQLKKVPTM